MWPKRVIQTIRRLREPPIFTTPYLLHDKVEHSVCLLMHEF